MCVQEEGKLKMELGESELMATEGKDHNQAKKKGKGKMLSQGGIKKANSCFLYKKKGHMKNMVDVIYNTWWIDSDSGIHISNTLQGMRNLRKPMPSE